MNPFENIDDNITTNGGGLITGSVLRGVLKNMLKSNLILHPTDNLNDLDVGKLVMFDTLTGKAVVTNVNAGGPGILMNAELSLPYDLIKAPKPYRYDLEVNINPTHGEVLETIGGTITFIAGTPLNPLDCEIGIDRSATAINLAAVLTSLGSSLIMSAEALGEFVKVVAGIDYHGDSGAGLFISYPSSIPVTVNTMGLNHDLDNLNQVIVQLDRNGSTYQLKISDIVAITRPDGIQLNGYKWPQTLDELESNVIDAMLNSPGFDQLNVYSGNPLIIDELNECSTGVTALFSMNSGVYVYSVQSGFPPLPGWVDQPVLGKLVSVQSGFALIEKSLITVLKTNDDIIFDPLNAINPIDRLLVAGPNGSLTRPDMILLNTNTYFGSPFYLALTPATAGSEVAVERFTFLGV